MIALSLSLCFICLAAIANAIMDNVNHHPSISALRNVWGGWWIRDWTYKYIDQDIANGRVKWNILGVKINKPVQITDGWHFAKMCMVIFIAASIACASSSTLVAPWYIYVASFAVIGIAWNTTFMLFYGRILRSGKSQG